ncbi:MAG: HEAT repeat domain-containing protein [Deltaproteobacteria bacterium]|nr:HEAT repeat domain-containing protein [Deltaproteobacteria bacterium]
MSFPLIYFVLGGSAVVLLLVAREIRERRKFKAYLDAAQERTVGGHTVFAGWEFIRELQGPRGGHAGDVWLYRVSIPDIFPSWFVMTWLASEPPNILPRIVFGDAGVESAKAHASEVSTIILARGDLIVESTKRLEVGPMAHVDDLAVSLAELCVARTASLEENLIRHVAPTASGENNEAPHSSPDALTMLLLGYPNAPSTWEAVRTAMGSPIVEMRLVAATALGPDGVQELERIVQSQSAPTSSRRKAIETLSKRGHIEPLVAALREAPEGVEYPLLQALRAASHPKLEPVVLPFLESNDDEIVERAADILARCGTRSALPALRAIAKRRFSPRTRTAARVAIEVISERSGHRP